MENRDDQTTSNSPVETPKVGINPQRTPLVILAPPFEVLLFGPLAPAAGTDIAPYTDVMLDVTP